LNPYQSPKKSLPVTAAADNAPHFLRRFTGGYYRVLGWIGLGGVILSILLVAITDSLYLDFTFLLWFWLGNSLKKGSSAARKWAIALFIIVTSFVIVGLFMPGAKAKFGTAEYDHSHPLYYLISISIAIVFAVPGVMLLGKRGREAFKPISTENG